MASGGVADDQVVLEADEEDRATGVALPAGPAPQLVVDPAAVVPAAADHVQPAQLGDPFPVGLVAAAEPDVDAPAGHLGGDGHRAVRAGLGDDRRLLGVVLGVEHARTARRPRAAPRPAPRTPSRRGCRPAPAGPPRGTP